MTREVGHRRWRRHGWARSIRGMACLYLGVAVLAGSQSARAGMHDVETCRRIKGEHEALAGSGIRDIMTKGPDWAKTNLTKERLEQVRRFLALEEDVRFRCPLGKARPELEAAENEAGSTTALQPGEPTPVPKSPPKSGRRAKAQAPGGTDKAGEQGSGLSTAAKASVAARPAAKPKAAAPKDE